MQTIIWDSIKIEIKYVENYSPAFEKIHGENYRILKSMPMKNYHLPKQDINQYSFIIAI